MNVSVDNGRSKVTVESVEVLYNEFMLMDVPEYYAEGGRNPYAGRVNVIPRKATVYAMILEGDADNLLLARKLLKGVGGRKKIRAVVCDKHEVNFNQFSRAGRIVVLYV